MDATPLPQIATGQRLAATLFDPQHRVLALAGTRLTEPLRREIGRRYYHAVPVVPGTAPVPPPVLDAGAHAELLRALHEAQRYLGGQLAQRRRAATSAGQQTERELRRVLRTVLREEFTGDPFGPTRTAPVLRWLDEAVTSMVVAIRVARRLPLPDADVEALAHGMLLRDIVLTTSSHVHQRQTLTPLVRRATEAHAEIAARLCKQLEWGDAAVRLVIAQHHERRDGSGYPRGLRGADLDARGPGERFNRDLMLGPAEVAAAADVFVALQQPRPHRAPLAREDVRAMMTAKAGRAFHPRVVTLLLDEFPSAPPIGQSA